MNKSLIIMKFRKPLHTRYLLSSLNNDDYCIYASVYSDYKKHGIRGIYAFIAGTKIADVILDISKGKIIQYGKRRLAVAVLASSTYISCPALCVITNNTKVAKVCKLVYTSIVFVFEFCEDLSYISFLPLNAIIFGQPISATTPGRFTSWTEITDVINNLPIIDDE